MGDLFESVCRELLRRKSRTLVNILGYVLAVGIIVVLVNLAHRSQQDAKACLDTTGTHFVAFVPPCKREITNSNEKESIQKEPMATPCSALEGACTGCLKKPFDALNEGFMADSAATGLIPFQFIEKVRQLQEVRAAVPFLLFRIKDPNDGSLFTISGFDTRNTSSFGTNYCSPDDIVRGSFLQPGQKGVVMLEEAYAISRNLRIGDAIQISQIPFSVIGILNIGIRLGKSDIYLSYDDAKIVINNKIHTPLTDECNIIFIEALNTETHSTAMSLVKQILPTSVLLTYACYVPASKVLGINERTLLIFSVFVIIGGFLLSYKSQLLSVIERRHDIAVLRSIGWTKENVLVQIISESLIQSAIGGILGCIFGGGFFAFISSRLPEGSQVVEFSFKICFFAICLSLLAGFIAGLIPTLGATRKMPADLLRAG